MSFPDSITADDDEFVVFTEVEFGDIGFGDYGLTVFWEIGVTLVVEIAQAAR